MKKVLQLIPMILFVVGCATQPVNPFSQFTQGEIQRIEICYTHDLIPDEFGMEKQGPFSDSALPTYKSYLIPITDTNLISRLYWSVKSVPLSPVESDQFWTPWSLCEQVFLAHDGRVLAIVSVGSHAPTIEVIEGYRHGGSVFGGRRKREHSFRGAATNQVYHTLLSEYLVEQVQTEWFMDSNNPGLRLREALFKKTGQPGEGAEEKPVITKPTIPKHSRDNNLLGAKNRKPPIKPKILAEKDIVEFGFVSTTNGVYYKEKVELKQLASFLGFEPTAVREYIAAPPGLPGECWVNTGSGKCFLKYISFNEEHKGYSDPGSYVDATLQYKPITQPQSGESEKKKLSPEDANSGKEAFAEIRTKDGKTYIGRTKYLRSSKLYKVVTIRGNESTTNTLPQKDVERIRLKEPPDLRRAEEYVEKGEYEKAIPLLENLLKEDEMFELEHKPTELLAECYLRLKQPNKALRVLKYAHPSRHIVLLYLETLLDLNEVGKAKQMIENLPEKERKMLEKLFPKLIKQDSQPSEEEAVKLSPEKDEEIRYIIGLQKLGLENYEDYLQIATSPEPQKQEPIKAGFGNLNAVNELRNKALEVERAGDKETASRLLDEAIRNYQTVIIYSDDTNESSRKLIKEALFECIPLLIKKQDYKQANQYCDRYLSLFSDDQIPESIKEWKKQASQPGEGAEE